MVRSEHDLLGDRDLPDDAYYGIQTLRAVENYQVTDIPISHFPNFPIALALVKKAAALANAELQLIPPDVGAAIVSACDDIIAGELLDEFVVDMIQCVPACRRRCRHRLLPPPPLSIPSLVAAAAVSAPAPAPAGRR